MLHWGKGGGGDKLRVILLMMLCYSDLVWVLRSHAVAAGGTAHSACRLITSQECAERAVVLAVIIVVESWASALSLCKGVRVPYRCRHAAAQRRVVCALSVGLMCDILRGTGNRSLATCGCVCPHTPSRDESITPRVVTLSTQKKKKVTESLA